MTKFPTNIDAPITEKRPVRDVRHGLERTDDYAWLRAGNWQEMFKDPSLLDPAIRAHLEAENAYQEAMMAGTGALQTTLFDEMKGRIKEDDSSVPMKHGAYAYGSLFVTGGEQPKIFRTPRDGGDRDIILDGDAEAAGKAYFRIGGADHSPDHDRLLWGYDDKGSEFYSLKIRDLQTGEDHGDIVGDTGGSGVWDAGGNGFFFVRLDENHRPSKLFHKMIGAEEKLIHEETDAGMFMSVGGSRSNKWIFMSIHDHETSEYRVFPADDPMAEPKLFAPRETGHEYDVEDGGDVFFILTNTDGAKDFKIMSAPADNPGRENWRDVVAHEPGRLILAIMAFERHLVRLERKDGLPSIVIYERATGEEHTIEFADEAYSLGLSGSYEYDTDIIRFNYSSMTTPAQVYDYNMASPGMTLLKTQEVPSGHDREHYVTRRLMAPGHDGELVPVSLIHHRDTPLDGTAPCLLYGYGSYGIAIPASFNTNILSLADRGFVYGIAHIRGGKDKGYRWYEDGKRENKANTFKDFTAAARYLIQENFTGRGRIVAQGGSAGGMLMGAVANDAPELFGGIIAEVPFVDVLNTMLDDTLPLTPPEWPEWGNPIASKTDYETIAAYCPYQNVAERDYPPILAVAGLTDPRVTYWEPAKWVAKLREKNPAGEPVLFKINLDAGHAGASGRFSRLEEIAYSYAFALKTTGLPISAPRDG